MCGKMNSYSDACSSIVAKNIKNIDLMLKQLVVEKDMCQTVGFCNKVSFQSDIVIAKRIYMLFHDDRFLLESIPNLTIKSCCD